MQKITPFLWFDNQAEEAAQFYTSLFENSSIGEISHYGSVGPGEEGSVMSVSFVLDGQPFVALNGGPVYHFNPAISLFVNCETQEEVDTLWEKLTEGGEEVQCGWLTDKYGLTWQIVPQGLTDLLGGPDPVKAAAATEAMLQMKKLDLAVMRAAYDAA